MSLSLKESPHSPLLLDAQTSGWNLRGECHALQGKEVNKFSLSWWLAEHKNTGITIKEHSKGYGNV